MCIEVVYKIITNIIIITNYKGFTLGEYKDSLLFSTPCYLFYNKSRWFERVVTALVDICGKEYDKEVRCIVTNSARAIKQGATGLVSIRNKNRYLGNKQGISYTRMVALQDMLHELGYIELYIGGVREYDFSGKPIDVEKSLMEFNETFLSIWRGVDVTKADVLEGFNCVEIKDRKNKTKKATRGVTGVTNIRKFMTDFNTLVSETYVSIGGHVIPSILYKRVFLDNLEKAGRIYNEGVFQQLSAKERSKILIDGESVVELDYGSLHASIAYELSGIQMEEDFKPYMIDVGSLIEVDWGIVESHRKLTNNPSYDPVRNLFKFALLCSFNCKRLDQASAAVSNELLTERSRDRNNPNFKIDKLKFEGIVGNIQMKNVCRAILDHNYMIQDYIFADKGIHFQAIDSRMAEKVIEDFMAMNEVALPWHDSFVVKISLEDKLRESMHKAYKAVLGTNMNCKVDKK